MNHSGYWWLFAAIAGSVRREKHRRGDFVTGRIVRGTLIHNGIRYQALPIGLLTVPLV
jgi:hypothetical protein